MSDTDVNQRSLDLHQKLRGKTGVISKTPLTTRDDLSLVYTPAVAEPSPDQVLPDPLDRSVAPRVAAAVAAAAGHAPG